MSTKISSEDSTFLHYLRGGSILVVVFGHVGGFWAYPPYSSFLLAVVPILFFTSGATSYYSLIRSRSALDYFKKRFIGLLTPYYSFCLFVLLVYICIHKSFPNWNLSNLSLWLIMAPTESISPFPVGQVWFIHALVPMMLATPLVYKYGNISRMFRWIFLMLSLILSLLQVYINVLHFFDLVGMRIVYSSVVYFFFYLLGYYYIVNGRIRSKLNLLMLLFVAVSGSVYCVLELSMSINFSKNYSPPNIYLLLGSTSILACVLILKDYILSMVSKLSLLESVLRFASHNAFSMFLLHTSAIFFAEEMFGMTNPDVKNWQYGVTKFIVVLILTILLALPFSKFVNTTRIKILSVFT